MAAGMRSAWSGGRLAALAGAVVLALVAGCSGGSGPEPHSVAKTGKADGSSTKKTSPPRPLAAVTTAPVQGATGVAPAQPVAVKAKGGTLTSVTVTNPDGKLVTGGLSTDHTLWTSGEPLGYAKTYTIAATATNADGRPTTLKSTFTTVTPANFTMPYLTPGGGTFGVGQPVVVHFDEPVPDRAAAERALSVTTSPPVRGAWNWLDSQNVHWRPPKYWTPGTHVTVQAKVYGVHLGGGLYGQADKTASFVVGSSKVAVVDDRTHMMQVFINGKKAHADIPVSMGRGGCITVNGNHICFTTQSGPHVVTEKFPVKVMSSASYGLPVNSPLGYEERIPLAVRISGSGEFVHAASWSVADQGVRNVSHGCINISPENAQWFYSTFGAGDIVDVRNTGVPLPATDGLGDWTVPWNTWVSGSALN